MNYKDSIPLERKFLSSEFINFDVKEDSKKDVFVITGHAGVFNNIDLGGDMLLPGSGKESFEEITPVFAYAHDFYSRFPIGAVKVATEDEKGFYMESEMPKQFEGVTFEDSYKLAWLIKNKGIKGMSFGYRTLKARWIENNEGEEEYRELVKVRVYDFSIVPFGMNPLAGVDSIKKEPNLNSLRDVEKYLRSLGLSGNGSKKLISKIKGCCDGSPKPKESLVRDELKSFNEILKNGTAPTGDSLINKIDNLYLRIANG
jgi:HK97 family phage prohead protease